jgi:hypothetical protein
MKIPKQAKYRYAAKSKIMNPPILEINPRSFLSVIYFSSIYSLMRHLAATTSWQQPPRPRKRGTWPWASPARQQGSLYRSIGGYM